MNKIDKMVLKETKYIACWTLLFSIIMQAVFLLAGQWHYTVLLGNLLSGAAGVLNFFFMGITVQRALTKNAEGAKATMKASQLYRMLFLLLAVIVGVVLPCFHLWAVIIPLFFPRLAIAIRPLVDQRVNK